MRTEPGPLKLGDDWTGFFIRGDEALGAATELRMMADLIEEGKALLVPDHLRSFARLLETCKE